MSRKTRRNASKTEVQNLSLRAAIRRLSYARMGLSGLALGSMAFSGQLYAADTTATTASDSALEEITVTGIRASLQQSLDIKRDSSGIVDALRDYGIRDITMPATPYTIWQAIQQAKAARV